MARKKREGQPEAAAYHQVYGVYAGTDMGPAVADQFRLGDSLAHDLYTCWHDFQRRRAELFEAHPVCGPAERAAREAREHVIEVRQHLKDSRMKRRTTRPAPENENLLDEAKAAARAAAGAAKTARKEAEKTDETLGKAVKDLESERRATAYSLYQARVAEGLHWSTGNEILTHHTQAVSSVLGKRAQGQACDVNRNPVATIGGQLRAAYVAPGTASPAVIAAKRAYKNILAITPWEDPATWRRVGKGTRASVRMRVCTKQFAEAQGYSPFAEFPVRIYRMLPTGADILYAKIKRERKVHYRYGGPKYSYTLVLNYRVPAPVAKAEGRAIDVRFGWKKTANGHRMAEVAAGPGWVPQPPALIARYVTREAAGRYLVHLPPSLTDRLMTAPSERRSKRDGILDALRPRIVAALEDPQLAEALGAALAPDSQSPAPLTPGEVTRWRSFARFHRLAAAWPEDHPLREEVTRWRKLDAHEWEIEGSERQQLTNRRINFFRHVACWLAAEARTLCVREIPVDMLRRIPDADKEDPLFPNRYSRRYIQATAPGELRMLIISAAKREGVTVTEKATGATAD